MYIGSNRVYKSTNRAVSDAIVRFDKRHRQEIKFTELSAQLLSPSDPDVIYVGTDDANVWVTMDVEQTGKISTSLPTR